MSLAILEQQEEIVSSQLRVPDIIIKDAEVALSKIKLDSHRWPSHQDIE